MNKIVKAFCAVLIACALMCMTACDIVGGLFPSDNPGNSGGNISNPGNGDNSGDDNSNNNNGNTGDNAGGNNGSQTQKTKYNIIFVLDGGTLDNAPTEYIEGEGLTLPASVTKQYHSFAGWYSSDKFEGNAITQISATDKGDKTFYVKWLADTYQVALVIDGNAYTGSDNVTSYSYGVAKPLPSPTRTGYNFSGWYDNVNCNGTAVTKIPENSHGDKIYFGKWYLQGALVVTACAGYEEGAYVELPAIGGLSESDYKISYKPADSTSAYVDIDQELVRITDNKVRADIVGLKAGSYKIRIQANSNIEEKSVEVVSYDRSGYAHFNYTEGVGAYNDDGTPKNNAQIIYVTEATKNTVKAKIGNTNCTGIVEILKNAKSSSNPLIIRVIGTVSAATWKKGNVVYTKTTGNTQDGTLTGKLKASAIVGKNGLTLPATTDSKKLTQQALIDAGYNELETGITELNGLSSKVSYTSNTDSEKREWDSCWNDCPIESADNVTVEGIGTDAKIFQWGMTWKKCKSIEVRNLTFEDYTEDACSFEGSSGKEKETSNFWVHHNTFEQGINYWDVCAEQDKREGDGATDFKRCYNITLSYNHYHDNHKTGLIGSANSVITGNVTFHHNYYDSCQSRLPLSRQANMHMYNNYYHNTTNTSISLRAYAYAFIEYCCFDGEKNTMIDIQSLDSSTANSYGVAKVYRCDMNGKGYSYQSMPASEKPSGSAIDSRYIKIVTDRTAKVTNYNKVASGYFDTDSTLFYYKDGKSDVTDLITDLAKVKTEIPKLAGVHKN